MQYAYIFAMAYAPQSLPLVCFGHFICLTKILGKVGGVGGGTNDLCNCPAGLEISQNRHLPSITKCFGIYGKNINLHWKSFKISLALQPEALVNTSGRVDFSSPALSVAVEIYISPLLRSGYFKLHS